jgi:putative dehydrogenase
MSERCIGVVGLGAMGMGMAKSLRRAATDVHVFDVRSEVAQAFAAEGGVACKPGRGGRACEIVVSVVVNAAQTEAVLFGEGGAAEAMKAGSVFVMCSTVDPGWSIALEKRLAEKGILISRCADLRGAAKAAKGEITMMTSGHPDAYAKGGGAPGCDGGEGVSPWRRRRRRQQGQDDQPASGRGSHRGCGGSDGSGFARGR